jgi:hypothetical protein
MPDMMSGDLQTLIATFQNTNVQLGNLIRAIDTPRTLTSQTSAQMGAYANDAAAAAAGVALQGLYINSASGALTARRV